jgi:hypothetical protein
MLNGRELKVDLVQFPAGAVEAEAQLDPFVIHGEIARAREKSVLKPGPIASARGVEKMLLKGKICLTPPPVSSGSKQYWPVWPSPQTTQPLPIMKTKLSVLAVLLVFALVAQSETQPVLNVVKNGVVKQISRAQLEKQYPAAIAQRVDPARNRADAIVGWYDKGNAYHEQKMEKNITRNFDKLKLVEKTQLAVQKVDTVTVIDKSRLLANPPKAIAQTVDPAKMRADAIVGWYDKGNAYHEQKMEKNLGKDLLKEKIQEKSQLKGNTLR